MRAWDHIPLEKKRRPPTLATASVRVWGVETTRDRSWSTQHTLACSKIDPGTGLSFCIGGSELGSTCPAGCHEHLSTLTQASTSASRMQFPNKPHVPNHQNRPCLRRQSNHTTRCRNARHHQQTHPSGWQAPDLCAAPGAKKGPCGAATPNPPPARVQTSASACRVSPAPPPQIPHRISKGNAASPNSKPSRLALHAPSNRRLLK